MTTDPERLDAVRRDLLAVVGMLDAADAICLDSTDPLLAVCAHRIHLARKILLLVLVP